MTEKGGKMLSRRFKRTKGKRKEPLALELKVQIFVGTIPIIIEILRRLLP